jgi:hypothetical protein
VSAYAEIASALDARDCWPGEPGRGNARCPAHDDTRASLSVGERRDGKGALVYCQAGCATAEVMAALDLPLAALFDRYWSRARGWAS